MRATDNPREKRDAAKALALRQRRAVAGSPEVVRVVLASGARAYGPRSPAGGANPAVRSN